MHCVFRWSSTHKHDKVCGSIFTISLTFARALRPRWKRKHGRARAKKIQLPWLMRITRTQLFRLSCWLQTLSYLQCPLLVSASNVRLWWTLKVSELPCACVHVLWLSITVFFSNILCLFVVFFFLLFENLLEDWPLQGEGAILYKIITYTCIYHTY